MTLMTRTHRLARRAGWILVIGLLSTTPAATAGGQDDGGVHMVPPDGDGGRHWPRWRGPSGQGVVEGTGYPDTWSDSTNVLWQTVVPGSGHSSPIVWGDRIFLTTSRNGGRRVSILSFRRSDGELLWDTDAPEGRPETTHGKNSPAAATATTDGERVYASFGSRGMLAVDFDGNIVWHREFGRINNYHGPAGSPLLYRDTVIIYQDQNGGAFVIALDTRTGETRWRTDRSASVGWGTPIAISVGDGADRQQPASGALLQPGDRRGTVELRWQPLHDELIVSSQRRVHSYNPVTGEELWSCGGNLFEVIPRTPAVGHGLLFCASGRAGPRLAIRPGGRGDVTDTHVAWKTTRGSPFVPSPLVYGDYLSLVNDMSSIITCLNAKTGETMWQERLGRPRREEDPGVRLRLARRRRRQALRDQRRWAYIRDEDRSGVRLDGANLLRINDIGARTLASPALVDGTWYIRTARELIAIGH